MKFWCNLWEVTLVRYLMILLGGLHAVLWSRGKPNKTMIELASRMRMHNADLELAVRHLNTRALTVFPICAVALFIKCLYTDWFAEVYYIHITMLWMRNEHFGSLLIQLQDIEIKC